LTFVQLRAREGYGSVRERDVAEVSRIPDRENPVSNASTQRRQNGKMTGQQMQQQPPVKQISSFSDFNRR
jgi:hypothetical protein